MSSTTHKYNPNRPIQHFNEMPPPASMTMTLADDDMELDADLHDEPELEQLYDEESSNS